MISNYEGLILTDKEMEAVPDKGEISFNEGGVRYMVDTSLISYSYRKECTIPYGAMTGISYPDMRQHLLARMHPGWVQLMSDEFNQPYMVSLNQELTQRRESGKTIYPKKEDWFNALRLAPAKVKVVILGQDPYHDGSAHGLAFSVDSARYPPSLKNILKEIEDDVYKGLNMNKIGNFTYLLEQGVLLLNTILTVEPRTPLAHQGMGWERFTGEVIANLTKLDQPIVWMLWGKIAQEEFESYKIESEHHLVLTAPHPSPFSAHTGFLGCKHFSQANEHLKQYGPDYFIKW